MNKGNRRTIGDESAEPSSVKQAIELCIFLRDQSRYTEGGQKMLDLINKRPQELHKELSPKENAFLKKKFCMLATDYATRYLIAKEFDKAITLFEKAKQMTTDKEQKAILLSNYACYFDQVSESKQAAALLDQAFELEKNNDNTSRNEGMAISLNNKAVIEMRQGNVESAFKSSKNAVVIIEPVIFNSIKHGNEKALRENKEFIEKLNVLLIAYFNLGITQVKMGNLSYAKTVFEHGWKMGKKFLGEEHYFSQRFKTRITKIEDVLSGKDPSESSTTSARPPHGVVIKKNNRKIITEGRTPGITGQTNPLDEANPYFGSGGPATNDEEEEDRKTEERHPGARDILSPKEEGSPGGAATAGAAERESSHQSMVRSEEEEKQNRGTPQSAFKVGEATATTTAPAKSPELA